MKTRITGDPNAEVCYYHVFSRVVNRDFVLGDEEREMFRTIMTQLLRFTGLEALAWCCLSNHFHILLKVPRGDETRASMTEEQLFERMKCAFSDQYIREVRWRVTHAREQGNEKWACDIIERLKNQMFDLSKFMHMLKRRFSTWFNKKHNRQGTLWEERYGSVLVEDSTDALRTMATYIDLNPVRAGLVADPKNYRWCGYAEALAGVRRAQEAIHQIAATVDETVNWTQAQEAYRQWLFGRVDLSLEDQPSTTPSRQGPPVIESARIEAELRNGVPLSRAELLRCRVRYFTAGAALGTRGFLDSVFQQNRHHFGTKRRDGPRPMRHGQWGELHCLRDLQVNAVTPPPPG